MDSVKSEQTNLKKNRIEFKIPKIRKRHVSVAFKNKHISEAEQIS